MAVSMPKRGFVVAMAAEFSFAVYDRPNSITRRVKQWIIVSRCGPNSEYMTVASAAGEITRENEVPIGLSPVKTAVGILASDSADESTFLLVRQRPLLLPIAGTFFPAEGYTQVVSRQGNLELRAAGRHAHSYGRVDGHSIRKDVPDPAPNARGAMAWHIRGVRCSWDGELFPRTGARLGAP